MYCYEDSKLLKLFSHVVRILYDCDIVGEDTIKFWYKKGSHPKVRTVLETSALKGAVLIAAASMLCRCNAARLASPNAG